MKKLERLDEKTGLRGRPVDRAKWERGLRWWWTPAAAAIVTPVILELFGGTDLFPAVLVSGPAFFFSGAWYVQMLRARNRQGMFPAFREPPE